jgi:general secretion pathway protein A
VVADRALLAAYAQEQPTIDGRLVRKAAREVFGRRPVARWWPWAAVAAGILAALAITTTTQQNPTEEELRLAVAEPASGRSPTPEAADPAPGPVAPARAPVEDDTLATADAGSTDDTVEAETAPGATEPAADARVTHEPSHALALLLSSQDFPTDSVSAAHELFNRWHATYDPSRGTACSQALAQRLRCMFLSGGSISELRRLNRPAMLTLTDENGGKHHVVMTALGYDDVELSAGGRSERVEIAELTHYWFGQDLLLWKPLGSEGDDLVLGARSPTVRWLRESLAKILDEPLASADPDLFDDGLAERVREFQRRQRLEVDGIVGTRTIIALQSLLGSPDVPMLSQVN